MAVIPDLVPNVASTVLPDGVRVERKGVYKWRRLRATLSWPTTIPRLEIPALTGVSRRTSSLLSVRSCCFVFNAFQPFVPHSTPGWGSPGLAGLETPVEISTFDNRSYIVPDLRPAPYHLVTPCCVFSQGTHPETLDMDETNSMGCLFPNARVGCDLSGSKP